MEITNDIIERAINNDEQAFITIYNETIKTAYFVAKRFFTNDSEAEDILQESYIAVFGNLKNYKSGNFQGWVDTIVANRCKNYLRKNNPVLFTEMEDEEGNMPEFKDDRMEFQPEEQADYNETKRLVMEIIDSLPVEQKMCVLMYYYEQMGIKDIAIACECSENTVKSRLNYARKYIKGKVDELEKKGTKLHSVAIIPFILWLLAEEAKAQDVPASVSMMGKKVTKNTMNIAEKGTKAMDRLGLKIAIGVTAAVAVVGIIIGVAVNKGKVSGNNGNYVTAEDSNGNGNENSNKVEKDYSDYIGDYVLEYRSISIVESEVGGVRLEITKYDGKTISGIVHEYESAPTGSRGHAIINFKDLPVVDGIASLKGLVVNNTEEYDGSITITDECIYLTIIPQFESYGVTCKHENAALYMDNSNNFVADDSATGADKYNNKFHVNGLNYSDFAASEFPGDIVSVESDEHFVYVIYEENVRVLYKGGLGDTVEYPYEYEGKPVREITGITGFASDYDGGFASKEDLEAVKKVIIPDTVWSIGAEGFAGMGITTIEWGKNVVEIGPEAFKNCMSLEEFTIPKSVVLVCSYFITGCDNIKKVNAYNVYLDTRTEAFSNAPINSFTKID